MIRKITTLLGKKLKAGKVTTSLFIEDTSIRLLVARGGEMISWASAPLEPGLVSDKVILDEAQVAERLKELFLHVKVGTKKVIAALSGLNSQYRIITLPELPEAVLSEAVKREAATVMSVSLDEAYLSYQQIPSPKGETRLFLATFPRNDADILIRTIRRAGLEPYILDLSPLALCWVPSEPRAIIVNARLGYLDIIVLVRGIPEVIRSLSLSDEPELSENIAAIAEELGRAVTFYNSSHAEEPLDSSVPVLVGGDLAEAPDRWQSLVGSLNNPVSVLSTPLEYPESFAVSEFMVNIGLATKKLRLENKAASPLMNFNALPEIYRPKPINLISILTPIGAVIGVGALVYLGFLAQNATANTAALRSQLTLLEASTTAPVKRIAALKEQITQVQAQIAPIQATDNTLKTKQANLQESRHLVDDDLHQLVTALPADVLLLKVQHSGETIYISGATQKEYQEVLALEQELRTNILTYADNLRKSSQFSEVIIVSIKYNPEYVEVTTEEAGEVAEEEPVEKTRQVKFDRFDFVFLLKSKLGN